MTRRSSGSASPSAVGAVRRRRPTSLRQPTRARCCLRAAMVASGATSLSLSRCGVCSSTRPSPITDGVTGPLTLWLAVSRDVIAAGVNSPSESAIFRPDQFVVGSPNGTRLGLAFGHIEIRSLVTNSTRRFGCPCMEAIQEPVLRDPVDDGFGRSSGSRHSVARRAGDLCLQVTDRALDPLRIGQQLLAELGQGYPVVWRVTSFDARDAVRGSQAGDGPWTCSYPAPSAAIVL